MRAALVNPNWSFEGSIYFGCREPHLPIELAAAKALLERAGHEARIVDAHLEDLSLDQLRARVADFAPDLSVITTAPTYLFWRCPPPELRVPMRVAGALRGVGGALVAVGPHSSSTPAATLRKLGADAVVIGECEEVLVELADAGRDGWARLSSIARRDEGGRIQVQGTPRSSSLESIPALRWDPALLARHRHHHHRFDGPPDGQREGLGAEVEWTRGCPYHCTFCNKEDFRGAYRKRSLDVVLDEIDGLVAAGVSYVYFIDEIFLPDEALLEALAARTLQFGVQLRIDNWDDKQVALLGRAGCRSIEAGVESISVEGRSLLAKRCRISTDQLAERLIHARRHVAFVQANLIDAGTDDAGAVNAWRERLRSHGVWANLPVPMFRYPGTPDYRGRWGMPDDGAWERAHADYLSRHASWSDIQDARPLPIAVLEADAGADPPSDPAPAPASRFGATDERGGG